MQATMIHDPVKAREFFENKMAFTTGPVELERMMKAGTVNIVDVRAADDYAKGHIPGAVNLPKESWSSLQGLRKDRTNVLYCYSLVCHCGNRCRAICRRGVPRDGIGRGLALVER
jgi:rhodanese-related sulfurtransferase